MKDVKGNEIKPGQTIKRIVPGKVTEPGYKYTVHQRGDELVADGGFITEILSIERAKEYEVISE